MTHAESSFPSQLSRLLTFSATSETSSTSHASVPASPRSWESHAPPWKTRRVVRFLHRFAPLRTTLGPHPPPRMPYIENRRALLRSSLQRLSRHEPLLPLFGPSFVDDCLGAYPVVERSTAVFQCRRCALPIIPPGRGSKKPHPPSWPENLCPSTPVSRERGQVEPRAALSSHVDASERVSECRAVQFCFLGERLVSRSNSAFQPQIRSHPPNPIPFLILAWIP